MKHNQWVLASREVCEIATLIYKNKKYLTLFPFEQFEHY